MRKSVIIPNIINALEDEITAISTGLEIVMMPIMAFNPQKKEGDSDALRGVVRTVVVQSMTRVLQRIKTDTLEQYYGAITIPAFKEVKKACQEQIGPEISNCTKSFVEELEKAGLTYMIASIEG